MNQNVLRLNSLLKEYRIKKNLTQEEMALKIGVSRSHYCAIENATRNPSIKVLHSINEVLPIFLASDATNRNIKKRGERKCLICNWTMICLKSLCKAK